MTVKMKVIYIYKVVLVVIGITHLAQNAQPSSFNNFFRDALKPRSVLNIL